MESYNFSPIQIANYFTCTLDREAGDSITHLKLQKLLYYAQSWSLVTLKKSLFEEDFQAWAHGPVSPTIWETYKDYGFESIPICECEHNLPEEVTLLLEDIKQVYGEKSAKYLEELTHSELPWKQTRGGLSLEQKSTIPISKDLLFDFYTKLNSQVNGN